MDEDGDGDLSDGCIDEEEPTLADVTEEVEHNDPGPAMHAEQPEEVPEGCNGSETTTSSSSEAEKPCGQTDLVVEPPILAAAETVVADEPSVEPDQQAQAPPPQPGSVPWTEMSTFGEEGLQAAVGRRPPQLPEFEEQQACRLRNSIFMNPRAFDDWLLLIKLVEESGPVDRLQVLYSSFLSEFPLCWGFWKRLAELEGRGPQGPRAALATYERAALCCGQCVDLWLNFCDAAHRAGEAVASVADQRQLYERALGNVGLDWRSGPLWERYLDFEEQLGNWGLYGNLLRRALGIATEAVPRLRLRLRTLLAGDLCPSIEALCSGNPQELRAFKNLTTDLANFEPPPEIARAAEAAAASLEIERAPKVALMKGLDPKLASQATAAKLACRELEEKEEGELSDGEIEDDELPPAPPAPQPGRVLFSLQRRPPAPPPPPGFRGEEAPGSAKTPKLPAPPPPKPAEGAAPVHFRGKSLEEFKAEAQRHWFQDRCEAISQPALQEAEVLNRFESRLQRHYFHNQALSEVQLETWRHYLAFEESRASPENQERLHGLYRRCLVVANNYLEFWLRYAAVLETGGVSPADASSRSEKACSLLRSGCLSGRLRSRPDALLAWAELEEHCGRADRARAILDACMAGCGLGSAEVALRRLDVERRSVLAEVSSAVTAMAMNPAAPAESNPEALVQVGLGRCENLLRYLVSQMPRGSPAQAFLARRLARFSEDELGRPEQALGALLSAWHGGCREASFLAELAALLLRAPPGPGVLGGTLCSEEHQAPGPCVTISGTEVEEYAQASALSWGLPRPLALCMAVFEEALEQGSTKKGVWAAYLEVLSSQGAPLELLRAVRRRNLQCCLGRLPAGISMASAVAAAEGPASCKRPAEAFLDGNALKLCRAGA